MQTTPTRAQMHDVAILGSGIAGTVLATVLARHGARPLIIDAGSHPRFAIGESTIPYTSMMMRIVGERFDVPEIKQLATFEGVRAKVTTQCGIKRNFGFVYHREGRRQDPNEVNQFAIPRVLHSENHFFRQAIDAHLLGVAVHYGVDVRQQTRIDGIDIGPDGVRLTAAGGEEFHARYVVDASGHASPLARHLALREEPTRFRHHARSLFTHMIGVTPYDDFVERRHRPPSPWSQGTLHHLFDGGWLWVIPFNNHGRATNPLVSVGLSLDPRQHPPTGQPAEEEFRSFIARFPDIERQFRGARSVRRWVSTGRLQYSSTQTVGERWCLTAHAAGFLDALFSRGLTNTLEVVHALAPRLLAALADDDFSPERFAYVERLEQGLLDFNDDLVTSAYASFADFDLWNATFRVWALGASLGTLALTRAYGEFRRTRDPEVLAALERQPFVGSAFAADARFATMLDRTLTETLAVQRGEVSARDAADRLFALLATADFIPPAFGFGDPSVRHYHPTLPKMLKTLRWAGTTAPPEIGALVRGGLQSFIAHRWAPGEAHPVEELRSLVEGGRTARPSPAFATATATATATA